MNPVASTHYALLGDPVHHSLSPRLHNAWFASLSINATYLCLNFNGTGVDLANNLLALGLAGCNLTTPLKERILPHLSTLDLDAKRSGAVNTICIRDGELHGYNTDVLGFKDSLREHATQLRSRTALIAGAGGAARAVAVACADLGITHVQFINRSEQHAHALADTLRREIPRVVWTASGITDTNHPFAPPTLIVDATRAAQPPEVLQKIIRNASPDCICYDLNYWRKAEDWNGFLTQEGLTFFDGRDMLLWQAIHAFQLFTGKMPARSLGQRLLREGTQTPQAGKTHG